MLKSIRELTLSLMAITSLLASGCTSPKDQINTGIGEFQNPIIWADAPDPDVIRVGDDFYMVTTTMHLMPGCPVMKSKDLVNWETIGYVFNEIKDVPQYDLENGTVYGRGQWATTLRYHDGTFYVLFSANDAPRKSFIYKATNPAGPWTLHARSDFFHDSSMLFDDDGRVYVTHGAGDIRLREMLPDLSGVKPDGVDKVIVHPDETEKGLHEGSRLIKHNGKYYLFVISWPFVTPRRQLCYRADNIEGPYEKKVVLLSDFGGFGHVGQGTMVDDADGNWWGVIFQDRDAVGRVLTLNPVRWVDGWPIMGDVLDRVPATATKKIIPNPRAAVVESDNFDNGKKSILWQWNHNPVNTAWSLTERPGYLRLHTAGKAESIFTARNTISQRMEGPGCEAFVKIDLSGMKPGDVAGFAALNGDSGILSVTDKDGKRTLAMQTSSCEINDPNHAVTAVNTQTLSEIPLTTNTVWLKISADFKPGRDYATFAYSTDGKTWNSIGRPFKMKYDYRRFFMGTRYAIFNYSTTGNGGYIDVDTFDYKKI